jgi:glyceraldehyde 3-phosphate dehydrogenase
VAAAEQLRGVPEYSANPPVSSDITGNPAPSIFDSLPTAANGRLVKAVTWYDNEWGVANRVVDTLTLLGR